jgi:hypothetical protein
MQSHTLSLNEYFNPTVPRSDSEQIQYRKDLKLARYKHHLRVTRPINFVSAKCGTGKTHWLAYLLADTNYCQNNLVAFPTRRLLKEFSKKLDKLKIGGFTGLHHKIITSDTDPRKVKKAVIEFLKQSDEIGSILLTTHKGLLDLPYFPNSNDWNVFIDEMPNVDTPYKFTLPENSNHLLDYIEVGKCAGESGKTIVYPVRVKPNKKTALKNKVKGHNDTVKESFIDLYRDLLSPYKDVYISENSLKTLQTSGEQEILFISILKPRQFYNWTIMSANFEESILYIWFKNRHNILFNEFTSISKNLRSLPDKKIQLFYYLDRDYSMTMRNNDWNVGQQIDHLLNDSCTCKDEWLYMANNDWDFTPPEAIRIPPKAHGLNDYKHVTNIAINYTENKYPEHIRMLSALGLDPDEIKKGTYYQTLYQSVCRTEIRDPSKDSGCEFIVPDEGAADYLNTIFGEHSTVEKIGNIRTGSPNLTKKQSDARYRNKKLVAKLLKTDGTSEVRDDIFFVTFHERVNGGKSSYKRYKSYKHLFKQFSRLADNVLDLKEESRLINAGVFTTESAARSHKNFVHSEMIILDFDNGKLSPEDFINVFWNDCDEKLRHTFFICNSWSRSESEPNRFRVFIPTSRTMNTISEYKTVYYYVLSRLVELESDLGLDPTSGSAVSGFYLPCTNINEQDWAFHDEYGTERELLPVDLIINNQLANKPAPDYKRTTNFKINMSELDELKLKINSMKSNRHDLIWELSSKMELAGLSESQATNYVSELTRNNSKIAKKFNDNFKNLYQ